MDAYAIMREWDLQTSRDARTPEEYDAQIPAFLGLSDAEYEEWKTGLEAKDKRSIVKGMKAWGLPIEALKPFELDSGIETAEREEGAAPMKG